jgi:hypothetical protein
VDVGSALQHGRRHDAVDEPDDRRLAGHVLEALNVIVADESLRWRQLARRWSVPLCFVEALQCVGKVLL